MWQVVTCTFWGKGESSLRGEVRHHGCVGCSLVLLSWIVSCPRKTGKPPELFRISMPSSPRSLMIAQLAVSRYERRSICRSVLDPVWALAGPLRIGYFTAPLSHPITQISACYRNVSPLSGRLKSSKSMEQLHSAGFDDDSSSCGGKFPNTSNVPLYSQGFRSPHDV